MKISPLYSKEWLWAACSALLTFFISYPFMGKYYFHPNQFMTAFGGDSWIILFDMLYHTKFGAGSHLGNMNYPEGEYIFLTDCQGSLSMVLNWINHYIFNIEKYVVGICNAINIWLVPVGGSIMYYLLRSLKVTQLHSVIFSGLILVLSPQFIRLGVHYGLAYPLIIPMFMLWFVRKGNVKAFEWRDLFMLMVILFFTFNNPYIGFATCFFLISAACVKWMMSRKMSKDVTLPILLAMANLAIVFITFKLNDPIHDRVKLQWGFFHYKATLEGFFAPVNSLVDQFLVLNFGKGFTSQFESWQNVGAVVVLTYVTWLAVSIMRKRKKWGIGFPPAFLPLFWGAAIVLTYASALLFLAFDPAWVESKMGFLLMFKASGRIAWSFYFAVTIGGVILLDKLLSNISLKAIKFPLAICIAAFWLYEITVYLPPFFKEVYNTNFLSEQELAKQKVILSDHHINADDFQAILQLPKTIFWSDKFRSEMNWFTQFHAVRTSLVTGLPIVNGYLSRISVGSSAERIELVSDPMIEKSLPSAFKNQKDLLIILGHHSTLSAGEQYLIDVSERLLDTLDHAYYRLPLERINEFAHASQNLFYVDSVKVNRPLVHFTFDDEPSDIAYYTKGAMHITEKEVVVLDTIIQDTMHDYAFSVWTHIDHLKYSCGDWIFDVLDGNGTNVFSKYVPTMESPDVQDDWIRTGINLKIEKGWRLKATMKSNQNFIIDELMLRPLGKDVFYQLKDDRYFLWNGVRILKPIN